MLKRYMKFYKPADDAGGDHLAEQEHERSDATPPPKKEASESDPDFEKRKAEFHQKFSAGNRASVAEGGRVDNKPNAEQIAQRVAEEKKHNEQREKEKAEGAKRAEDKPKPFIKQQIERAKSAEQERDEAKSKAAELETRLAAIEKEKTELASKIESGDYSPKREAEMQEKLTKLETEYRAKEEALVNENQEFKKKLAFYDLTESEDFQREYLAPVQTAFNSAAQVIGNDKQRAAQFHQALVANGVALRSADPAERANAEQQRDALLSQITDGMPDFTKTRFTDAVFHYIDASQKHAKALMDHEKTTAEVRSKRAQIEQREQAERLGSWGKVYDATASTYDEEAKITDDEKKLAKELGIDIEAQIAESNLTAKKAATGQVDMQQALDFIHRGRILPVFRAKLKIMSKQLKERDELITKLRGGGPESDGGAGGGGGDRKDEKPTREQWHQKFAASRVATK